MTHLVNLSTVRETFELSDIDDINTPLSLACDTATLFLEGILDTEFVRATVTDTFYVNAKDRVLHNDKLSLLLSHGFLTGSPSTILAAPEFDDLVGSPLSNTDGVITKLVKGEVSFMGASYKELVNKTTMRRFHMQVTYEKGFTSAAYPDGSLYDGVPDWLSTVALHVTNDLRLCGSDTSRLSLATRNMLNTVLQPKLRYAPYAVKSV